MAEMKFKAREIAEVKIPIPDYVLEAAREVLRSTALEMAAEVKALETQIPPYMDKKTACRICGVAPSTFGRWVKNEGLKEIRVDGKVIISRDEILRFMAAHTV